MQLKYASLVVLFLIALFHSPSVADDYIWPTDASRLFSSSFAESRSGRFHAGVDIKTQGITGFPIFAVRDGYVSRINVSPFGYGRALYLTLDTGEIVVYGHLERFNDEIDAYVRNKQKSVGKYKVDFNLKSTQFPVAQGDTLGFTGQSGVGYPHLHFEMRNAASNPINPLSKGYTVVDNVAPRITKVLIQPLDALSSVDYDFQPKIYWPLAKGNHTYVIDRAIQASGRIGIGVSAYDQMDNVGNSFGTYCNELYVDGQLVFSAKYDRFSYGRNNHFKLDRDWRQLVFGRGTFYNLFVDFGNKLPFYGGRETYSGVIDFKGDAPLVLDNVQPDEIVEIPAGVLSVDGTLHTFEIVVRDYWGNASRVRGRLHVDGSRLAIRDQENSTLDSIYNASRFAGGLALEDGENDPPEKAIELKTKFFDRYIRITLASSEPLQDAPQVTGWLCSGKKYRMPLIKKSAYSYVGAWPLSGCDIGPLPLTVLAVTQAGDTLLQNEWIEFTTVARGQAKTVMSVDSLCRLDFKRNTLFKDLFVRIDTLARPVNGYDVVGRFYRIRPVDVPLKKSVTLSLAFPENDSLPGKLGVYRKSGGNMRYVGANINWNEHSISARTSGLGTFALVRDVAPPIIMALSPGNLSRTTNPQPRLRAVFKDKLSGIGGEESRVLKLDGEKVIAEYDPEALVLFYTPEEPLAKGEHTVEIVLIDRSGNRAQKKHVFYID